MTPYTCLLWLKQTPPSRVQSTLPHYTDQGLQQRRHYAFLSNPPEHVTKAYPLPSGAYNDGWTVYPITAYHPLGGTVFVAIPFRLRRDHLTY